MAAFSSPDFSQKIICLTGQMASGKNTVAKFLEEKGFACVDFDILVHEAIKEKNLQIQSAFEKEAQENKINLKNADGSLARRELGKLIFGNPELIKRQENIVYPEVTKKAVDFVHAHKNQTIVFNVTLLYKIPELMKMCSSIIFVTSPIFLRLLRAKKRDKISYFLILKRFASQKNLYKAYKKTGIPIIKIKNSISFKPLKSLKTKIERSLKKI